MNDLMNPDPGDASGQVANLRQLTMINYILYALAPFNLVTALVAIIINYVKRDDAAGTLYESHFTWQIRTFWWGLLWCAIGTVLSFVVIGIPILIADAVWLIYRIVKGFLNWNDGKPMDVT